MLKLKNISPIIHKIDNKSDYYIPIKIIFEKIDFSDEICYWNAYGKKDSLVQIGLSNPTGIIHKIICFLHPTIKYLSTSAQLINIDIPTKMGLPSFETYIDKYQEGYYHIDENIDFTIHTNLKNILILLSQNTVILHVINDFVIFGFDNNNNLCYICMQNMNFNDDNFLEKQI